MSKFAVIIPLYKHAQYIRETLESVLAQSARPARILVLDDGSPDDSLAVARAVAEKHPLIEVHAQENQGAHHTLNRLVTLAEGCEYVAILNSDDRFHPRRLEVGAAFLEAHPDVQLLCTGLRIIGTEGDALPSEHPRSKWFRAAWSCAGAHERGELSLSAWLGRTNFPATTSNFMARREFLLAHPMGNYRFAHDYFLLLEAALEEVLAILPEPLLDYRVHENNTITTEPVRLTTELLGLMLDLKEKVAPRLAESSSLRAQWAAFLAAVPENISGVRWDCLAAAMAGGREDFPELAEFPNKDLVNRWDGAGDLWGGSTSEMARALAETRSKMEGLKGKDKQLAGLREAIKASAWLRWGRRFAGVRRILEAAEKRS